MRSVTTNPKFILPFLQVGRIFRIVVDGAPITTTYEGKEEVTLGKSMDFGWGILIHYQKKVKDKGVSLNEPTEGATHMIDMLLYCAPGTDENNLPPRPCPLDSEEVGDMVVVPCNLNSIDAASSVKVYAPKNIKSRDQRTAMRLVLKEVGKRFGGMQSIPLLDPITDMGIKDEGFQKLMKVLQNSANLSRKLMCWILGLKSRLFMIHQIVLLLSRNLISSSDLATGYVSCKRISQAPNQSSNSIS